MQIQTKNHKPVEIGGEFQWLGLPPAPYLPWPDSNVLFALARNAMVALWEGKLKQSRSRALFIPDYFCQETHNYWKSKNIKIRTYKDDPRWPHPQWETLNPDRGDVVLAVNYFGVKDGSNWEAWRKRTPHVILVEDHSHDPFSKWAQTSCADFAFASIRKTTPVPDGAILWSPQHKPLPPEPEQENWSGSALKLAGMILKREYLGMAEADPALKERYLAFLIDGENQLVRTKDSRISAWSRFLLAPGFAQKWRIQREKNVQQLIDMISACRTFKPLFTDWPSGHCPLNAVIIFESETYRESFRKKIISKEIYTPVHWWMPSRQKGHATDLSKRILSIPVDQRYNAAHINCIANTIKAVDRSL